MSIDLAGMSKEELERLISDASKALKTVDARKKAQARRAAEEVAKEHGFSLSEILDGGTDGGPKGVPKYANPSNPDQTWTGRGRKPNWLIEALEAGKSMEELSI
ncbi:H-NS family nucleoid-associated regulatory protein [Sagittula salina]|uniref:H-NS histone family protein n=1 Tax=Sagittula salina TaxID=2820268 RepID=A0A940S494_9RHOB|nr:H-NS histone family protein [Sagittula salina]MBP0483635.1 H-NS histone family protein [Sagittula salina]